MAKRNKKTKFDNQVTYGGIYKALMSSKTINEIVILDVFKEFKGTTVMKNDKPTNLCTNIQTAEQKHHVKQ